MVEVRACICAEESRIERATAADPDHRLGSYAVADLEPPLDSQRPANGGEQSAEQQVAKGRKRRLGSRCGTRVRGVLGSLHGLVTCLLQFRLRVIEPLDG